MNRRKDFDYDGMDLEAMAFADNYYKWLMGNIKPYIGHKVVEVGAGVGSFSRLLLEHEVKNLALVEPSKSMYSLLVENVNTQRRSGQQVATHNSYLQGITADLKKFKPDTFIYVNVFEHIKNDKAELDQITEILKPGGHVIIFVPALQSLYSNFDKSIDHYRRYNKKDLRKLCEAAGLEVVTLRYMDMVGILPWWFSFVVMKRTSLVPLLVKVYDNVCVPIIRVFESIVRVPVGKNLLIVAKKQKNE